MAAPQRPAPRDYRGHRAARIVLYIFIGGLFLAAAAPERTHSQVLVAPFRGKERVNPGEWIPVTDGSSWDDKACWSADGDLLYFTSDRDGWRCIYAQRLDHQTRRPLQESAIEVLPIHGARLSARNIDIQDFDFAVAAGKLVINLGELTGNLWLADLEEE